MIEGQTTLFDFIYKPFKIDKPIRLIELFGGYGSQALALKYLGVNFEHWKLVEWAVKSIQAYKDIHFSDENVILMGFNRKEQIEYLYKLGISNDYNKPMTKEQIERLSDKQLMTIVGNILITHNLVNIQNVKGEDLEIVDTDKYCYIMTYSFPCQDLSLAGKGKGMSDTSTRSGLLWEVERILTECKEKPQVLLMENVPMVHSVDNLNDFNKWKARLEELGYKNYFQDLIATDYEIPQTRNRCFMVSILGEYNYTFPKPIPLKLRLKDMLEDNVNEKYYLSDKLINCFLSEGTGKYPRSERFLQNMNRKNQDVANSITTLNGNRATDTFIRITKDTENYIEWEEKGKLDIDCRASKEYKVSATICTTPKNKVLLIKNATKNGYLEATEGDGIDISSRMKYHRGTVQKDKAQTLTTQCERGVVRIRKLTPKECFRLMGVKDEDYERCAKNQSDSSLYHLAGDSIVVNVLMAIFKEML